MRPRPRHLPAAAALAATAAIAHPVWANHFAPDGSFLFESQAAHADGFEDRLPPIGTPYDIPVVSDALEGTRVLACSTQYESVDLPFDLPSAPAVYEATLWLRGDGFAGISVDYEDGSPGDFTQLYPTGRMTSDGWMEMRSSAFSVDGARGARPYVMFLGTLEADAFEVHFSEAMAFAGPQRCKGLKDPSCDGERTCLDGWCRNPRGWVPPMPDDQEVLADYLHHRLRFFFAPYLNRDRHLEAALAETEAIADAPSRWRFWKGFAAAIQRLRDSHTRVRPIVSAVLPTRKPLQACFTPGDGDATQQQAPSDPTLPDVIVSHSGKSHHWDFRPGDRLVSVDGKHPLAWMQSLIGHDLTFSPANDPASVADRAERLRTAIPRYASTITVIRCDGKSCAAPGVVDVSAVPEVEPGSSVEPLGCDHRPQPLVPGQGSSHSMGVNAATGRVIGTEPEEAIYGLVWDTLIPQSPADAAIQSAVQTWRNQARGVVIDHRAGNGGAGSPGSTSIADPILSFVLPPTLFGVSPFRRAADEEGPSTTAEGLDLVAKYETTLFAWRGGGPDPRTDVPVALLITRDVSLSDLFAYAFSKAERVRVFGPHPTHGAYSTFFGMSYWYGFNYQIAAADTIGADGVSLCGRGAAPHQVVLPRQTDLVAGKDTLVHEALSWIRKETAP